MEYNVNYSLMNSKMENNGPILPEQSLDERIDEFINQKTIGEVAADFLTEIDDEAE